MRRLEYLPLDELQRAEVNPKDHDAPGIRASIGRFGFVEPIILDERTGRLIAGHGRLDDLQERRLAGEDPPEGIEVEDGVWRAPVIRGWASENDAEAKALLVAVNRLPERGGWVEVDLLELLSGFEQLDGTGFEQDDLAVLRDRFHVPELDGLAERYGDMDPSSLWTSFSVRADPLVKARAERALAQMPGDNDSERLAALLDKAGA